jgi:AcrR family transcriptional regulator
MSVAADHRARLIEGLAAALREKGLANTQVSDIVRHAKASRSTFYNSFEDKDACFIALAETTFQATLAQVREAIDPDAPWETQVDQSIEAFLTIFDSDRALAVSFVNDLPMLGERGERLRAESTEQYAELVLEVASGPRFREAGIADVSIEQAVLLMSGLDGMIHRAVQRGEDLMALAPIAQDAVKRILRP